MPAADPFAPVPHDPYLAWRFPNFRLYSVGGLAWWIGYLMLATVIDWHVYDLTNSTVALGLVGLTGILPVMGLALPAGHLADRLNRKHIVLWAMAMVACSCVALSFLSHYEASIPHWPVFTEANHLLERADHLVAWRKDDVKTDFSKPLVPVLYLIILVIGIAQALGGPARSALLPSIIPIEIFSSAVTWNSSIFQIAAVSGPALGGLLVGVLDKTPYKYSAVYALTAVCTLVLIFSFSLIKYVHTPKPGQAADFRTLIAGIHFVFEKKIILATITLDLFAVLLGGAVALLPVFAKDILHRGPMGLGLLRSAPAVGAFVMALILAYRPPMKQAGKTLLWAVAGFGAATIVFGLSNNFWLSMAMLFFTGVFDNISVVVRHTLVQVLAPDAMRGRVSAVNNIFIGASNEMGAFESGVTARMFGPVTSVVGGGIGTILVVASVALAWPQVREFGSLHDARPEEEEGPSCKSCGYDLRGNPGATTCPECGAKVVPRPR